MASGGNSEFVGVDQQLVAGQFHDQAVTRSEGGRERVQLAPRTGQASIIRIRPWNTSDGLDVAFHLGLGLPGPAVMICPSSSCPLRRTAQAKPIPGLLEQGEAVVSANSM